MLISKSSDANTCPITTGQMRLSDLEHKPNQQEQPAHVFSTEEQWQAPFTQEAALTPLVWSGPRGAHTCRTSWLGGTCMLHTHSSETFFLLADIYSKMWLVQNEEASKVEQCDVTEGKCLLVSRLAFYSSLSLETDRVETASPPDVQRITYVVLNNFINPLSLQEKVDSPAPTKPMFTPSWSINQSFVILSPTQ